MNVADRLRDARLAVDHISTEKGGATREMVLLQAALLAVVETIDALEVRTRCLVQQ